MPPPTPRPGPGRFSGEFLAVPSTARFGMVPSCAESMAMNDVGDLAPAKGSSKRVRASGLLSRIGLLSSLAVGCQLLGRRWPAMAALFFTTLFFVGIVWLAVLVLRTGERAVQPTLLSPLDRWLMRWSGLLSVVLLGLAALVMFIGRPDGEASLAEWRLTMLELLMTTGFVLSLACANAPRGMHVWPRWCWKLLCALLVFVFGAYALLIPIGRVAGTALDKGGPAPVRR